jgi:hypothetical protein
MPGASVMDRYDTAESLDGSVSCNGLRLLVSSLSPPSEECCWREDLNTAISVR